MSESKKTTLIYFGSKENSKYGTLRSIITLTLVSVLFLSLKYINSELFEKLMKRKTMLFVSLIAVVSAMTVIVPSDSFDAAKYGASVGAVVSIIFATAWSEEVNIGKIIFIISSIVSGALISTAVYNISTKLDWYPFLPC